LISTNKFFNNQKTVILIIISFDYLISLLLLLFILKNTAAVCTDSRSWGSSPGEFDICIHPFSHLDPFLLPLFRLVWLIWRDLSSDYFPKEGKWQYVCESFEVGQSSHQLFVHFFRFSRPIQYQLTHARFDRNQERVNVLRLLNRDRQFPYCDTPPLFDYLFVWVVCPGCFSERRGEKGVVPSTHRPPCRLLDGSIRFRHIIVSFLKPLIQSVWPGFIELSTGSGSSVSFTFLFRFVWFSSCLI